MHARSKFQIQIAPSTAAPSSFNHTSSSAAPPRLHPPLSPSPSSSSAAPSTIALPSFGRSPSSTALFSFPVLLRPPHLHRHAAPSPSSSSAAPSSTTSYYTKTTNTKAEAERTMGDLVVGLAKSVVEGALTQVQSAIEEEAKLRHSAQRNLVFITGEFEMMHSFLSVADEERVKNSVVRTWVRQVRELAYDVEDCIEFVVHLDNKPHWWRRLLPSCVVAALPLDEALAEIEQLKARVEDVSKRNTRYSLISDSGSKPVMHQLQPAPSGGVGATTLNMLIEARDAAKRQQGLGDLTQLITKNDDALQVTSVWGTGGDLGTTSIIRKAYCDPEICRNFECRGSAGSIISRALGQARR